MLIVSTDLIKEKKIPWTNTLYIQKALDVLFNMAHSLSDTDPLQPYLLQVINNLKFKLSEPLEMNKWVGDLSCNNILIKDFNIRES